MFSAKWILRIYCLLIFLLITQNSVFSQTDAQRYIWNLSTLFKSKNEWESERKTIKSKIEDIKKFKGTLAKDPISLANAMDAVYDLRSRAGEMYMYGVLNYETNVNSEEALFQYDIGTGFESKVESAVAFIRKEVIGIGRDKILSWLNKEPRLERHKSRLNRILYEAPYTLKSESQKIVESMTRWQRLPIDIYENIINKDLGWGRIKDNKGNDIIANPDNYRYAIKDLDYPNREKIITAYYERLNALQDIFGILLTRRIEADFIVAKHRGFKSGMDAIWYLRDGMPIRTHTIAINVARENLDVLNKYLKLQKKVLGLNKMSYSDIYVKKSFDKKFTVKETENSYLMISKLFGEAYQNRFKERIKKPWMHLARSENKSGIYGIFPAIDDSNPFIVMTFTGSLASSRALAGAFALMMAYADISQIHPSDTRDDPPVFSNAMIYLGNMLYYDNLIKNAKTREEKINYLFDELNLLVRKMFKYPMMADFETRIENLVSNNENPTGNIISKIYIETLNKYFGNDPDILKIDDKFSYDWINQGIMFLSYEDQFWYGAGAAAASMYEKLQKKDPKIINFVSNGYGTDDWYLSYKMFLGAGIDLSSKAPYRAFVKLIDDLSNQLEELLNKD